MTERKHVLICNERFIPRYGLDRALVLLARQLAARGHLVSFACLRYEPVILNAISCDIRQIKLPLDIDHNTADRHAAAIICAAWEQHRPNVMITGGWPFFELAARAAAYGIPSIFIDAGAVPHGGYAEPNLSIQREVRRLRARTLPFIGRILPVSDFIRVSQTEPDRGHHDGVRRVWLGADHMDDMAFEPAGLDLASEQSALDALEKLSSAGIRLILVLGRFEPEGYKNSPSVFDIFRSIRRSLANVHLVVLSGPDTISVPGDLEHDTTCLSTLSDAGLQRLMCRSDLGLSVSLWEGFNLPLAEMQYAGRPVLAFNTGAHPEVIADPWFLCGTPSEMTRKAVRLLGEGVPPPIVRRERFKLYRERFRWAETVKQWITELEAVANSGSLPVQSKRRIVLMDVTNSGCDPANSGVTRVTRRLAAQLAEDPTILLIFVIWNRNNGTYRILTEADRSFLGRYAGPVDRIGTIIGQFTDEIPLQNFLMSIDPRSKRQPVLFLPEVILDGSAQQRVAWGRNHGLKIAFILHDMLPISKSDFIDKAIVDVFPAYIEAMRQADAIWATSQFSLDEFESYCISRGDAPPIHREVIWLPGQFSDHARITSLPPNTGDIRILTVSTIEPRKNHRNLIEAFRQLRSRRPALPVRLTLVGNQYIGAEALANWLREAERQDSRIEWLGSVSDEQLTDLYSSARFTVYPSLVEGFGLPVLESLWMGRPCICNENGVMAELAAGGGCLTVDVTDTTELSMAIERLSLDDELLATLHRQIRSRPIDGWADYGDAIADRLTRL